MTAATPPPPCTLFTLSAKLMAPRWHRTTLLAQAPLPFVSQRPPSARTPEVPGLSADPSMPPPSQVVAPELRLWVPTQGIVESTATPGAASSTSAFFWEKSATALCESIAAIDTTVE